MYMHVACMWHVCVECTCMWHACGMYVLNVHACGMHVACMWHACVNIIACTCSLDSWKEGIIPDISILAERLYSTG